MKLRPHRQSTQEELEKKFVYDFGCSGDLALVKRISSHALGYIGFDHNEEWVRELQYKGYDVRLYDFDHPSQFTPPSEALQKPTIILLNEVLEHLANPGNALKQLHQIAAQHNYCTLLIGVPNRHSLLLTITYWITGRDFDPTDHNFGYSAKNLSGLLQKTGWKPVRLWYCYHDNSPTDNRCRIFPGLLRKLEFPLRWLITRIMPRGAPILMCLVEPTKA